MTANEASSSKNNYEMRLFQSAKYIPLSLQYISYPAMVCLLSKGSQSHCLRVQLTKVKGGGDANPYLASLFVSHLYSRPATKCLPTLALTCAPVGSTTHQRLHTTLRNPTTSAEAFPPFLHFIAIDRDIVLIPSPIRAWADRPTRSSFPCSALPRR